MKALVEAALVGTARQPDRAHGALGGDMPVDALVAALDEGVGVERRVLLAAALHDTYARAGRVPLAGVDVVPSAGSETAPHCAPVVTALLARGILGERLTRTALAGVALAIGGVALIGIGSTAAVS